VNPQCVKTWKIIGDNLSKAGWTCRCISSTDHEDRQFELRPQSAGRFIVRADEKLWAFLELESAVRPYRELA